MLKLKRGKRTDNGEWVVGFYFEVKAQSEADGVHAFILLPEKCLSLKDCFASAFEVVPETVGDDSGRVCCDGSRIFEGDILQYYDDEIQVVEWWSEFSRLMLHTYSVYEEKRNRKLVKKYFSGWNDLEDYPLDEMPILGNAFDNSELIRKWCGVDLV